MATVDVTRQPEYPFGGFTLYITGLRLPDRDGDGTDIGTTREGILGQPIMDGTTDYPRGGDYLYWFMSTDNTDGTVSGTPDEPIWSGIAEDKTTNSESAMLSTLGPLMAKLPVRSNGVARALYIYYSLSQPTLSNGTTITRYTYYDSWASFSPAESPNNQPATEAYYVEGLVGQWDKSVGMQIGSATTIYVYAVCPNRWDRDDNKNIIGVDIAGWYLAGRVNIVFPNNFNTYMWGYTAGHSRTSQNSYTVTIGIAQNNGNNANANYGKGMIHRDFYDQLGFATQTPSNYKFTPYLYGDNKAGVIYTDNVSRTSKTGTMTVPTNWFGTTRTFYPYVVPKMKDYYPGQYSLNPVNISFDAMSYYATTYWNSCTDNTITVSQGSLNSTINLNSNYYLSTSSADMTSSINITDVGTRGSSITMRNLSPNSIYTRNVYVHSTATGLYYKTGSVSGTTDSSSYYGNLSVSLTEPFNATVYISGVSPATNLNNMWYLTDTDSGSVTTALSGSARLAPRAEGIAYTGLSPGVTYTRYAYVYSTMSGRFYKVDTIQFIPFGASVNVWDEANKKWNTHISTVKAEDGSFKYCEGRVWDKTNNRWRDF